MGIAVFAAHSSVNSHVNTRRNSLQQVNVNTQIDNVSSVKYLTK